MSTASPVSMMTTSKARFLLASLAVAGLGYTSGCSSEVNDGDDGGGGSGGNLCEGYEDIEIEDNGTDDLIFRVVNNTAGPIFLADSGDCSGQFPIDVQDSAGTDITWQGDACTFTCEMLQGAGVGCPAICAIAPLVVIAPGGTADVAEWQATHYAAVEMPASCYGDDLGAQSTCPQLQVAPDGQYTVSVNAFRDASCQGNVCACPNAGEESCEVEGFDVQTSDPVSASGTVTVPTDNVVEIVFADPVG